MEELLQKHPGLVRIPSVGDLVSGSIIEKSGNAVYIDLGALGVGAIYGRELFDDIDTFKKSRIGDSVQAKVQRYDNEDGCVELSLRLAARERSWENLRPLMNSGEVIDTQIVDANKGGLLVRVHGVLGFLPVSQLAPDHYPRVEGGDKNQIYARLHSYIGQKFQVKVLTASDSEEKLIVSEKAAMSDELSEMLHELGQGRVVEGTVSGIVEFGVFVKFMENGKELEGLVHISELAWQRVETTTDVVKLGQRVKAKVIGVDNGLRISLSIKQLTEDPWKKVEERYKLGSKVHGVIAKVTLFGAFVKLDDDIHGLLHVSEFPEKNGDDSLISLTVGKEKEFTIISLEPADHRMGLSLRSDAKIKQSVQRSVSSDNAKTVRPETTN